MAKTILTGVRLFTGGVDLTGVSNQVDVSCEAEVKDTTNFASGGWKEGLAGLCSTEIKAGGQWEAGDTSMVDDATWADLGGVGPWTICPVGAAVGDLAYLTSAMRANYSLGGAVGDVAPWKSDAQGSWPLVRGSVAHPPGTARTATGNGTAVNLGAVTAGQRIYAAVHVLSVSGTGTPSVTVTIESDDNSNFTSATTRLTATAATARGGQILRSSGSAITDTWWRAAWTVAGTTPSFLFAVAFGIK